MCSIHLIWEIRSPALHSSKIDGIFKEKFLKVAKISLFLKPNDK